VTLIVVTQSTIMNNASHSTILNLSQTYFIVTYCAFYFSLSFFDAAAAVTSFLSFSYASFLPT